MNEVSRARGAIGLLINRNSVARHRCLETMRYLDDGHVKVRIGGPIRGKVFTKPSRSAAVRAVNKYYDDMLYCTLQAHGWRRHREWMGASVRRIFHKYTGKNRK